MQSNSQKIKQLIQLHLNNLNKSLSQLEYSYNKCKTIGIKEDYTDQELEAFEALTARFSRTVDILTQKLLVSIYKYLREEAQTFLDRALLAEKIGLVDDAQILVTFRDLRNEISYEYSIYNLNEIFEQTLENTPNLKLLAASIEKYLKIKQIL